MMCSRTAGFIGGQKRREYWECAMRTDTSNFFERVATCCAKGGGGLLPLNPDSESAVGSKRLSFGEALLYCSSNSRCNRVQVQYT